MASDIERDIERTTERDAGRNAGRNIADVDAHKANVGSASRGDMTSRLRDVFVVASGSMLVLVILASSGALGWVEALTAAVVIGTGSGAYYVGSSHAPPQYGPQSSAPRQADGAEQGDVRAMVEAMPLPALMIDKGGRISMANTDARAIFRLAEGQAGLAAAILRDPALLDAIERVMQQSTEETIEFTRSGAADRVWFAHIRRVNTAHDGAMMVLEDRSEIRRAEQARADFLANASHELRTPLTSLAGFVETMRGPARDDRESWDRFLDIMYEQTERMRRLIADLLSLSRIEFKEHRPPTKVHDFSKIIARATQALVPVAAERDISLVLDAPKGAVHAVTDPDEITQAVQNLIANAVKYSPDGGHVAVEMGRAPTLDVAKAKAGQRWDDGARMTLLEAPRNPAAEALYVRVTDEGPGISSQHLPRLGQRFYRVDSSRGGEITGTGLGLAIVKHVLTRHRGGLIIESIEGHGSSFGFWLPATAEPGSDSVALIIDGQPPAKQGLPATGQRAYDKKTGQPARPGDKGEF